jgi:hypothetical protein
MNDIKVGDAVKYEWDVETIVGTVKAIKPTLAGIQYVLDIPGATGLAANGVGVYGVELVDEGEWARLAAEQDPHGWGLIRPWDHP